MILKNLRIPESLRGINISPTPTNAFFNDIDYGLIGFYLHVSKGRSRHKDMCGGDIYCPYKRLLRNDLTLHRR